MYLKTLIFHFKLFWKNLKFQYEHRRFFYGLHKEISEMKRLGREAGLPSLDKYSDSAIAVGVCFQQLLADPNDRPMRIVNFLSFIIGPEPGSIAHQKLQNLEKAVLSKNDLKVPVAELMEIISPESIP